MLRHTRSRFARCACREDRCRLVVVGVERWSDEVMQWRTSSDAVQHVLGLATALDEDDRHFLRAGGRSFTGLVAGSTPGSDGPTPDLFGEV